MKITCHVSVSDFTPNVHTIATSTLRMNEKKKHPIKTHSFSDPLKKNGDIHPKTDFFFIFLFFAINSQFYSSRLILFTVCLHSKC